MNSMILLGCFKGGDIEPGTFHTKNIEKPDLSEIEKLSDGMDMPEQEQDEESDAGLVPPDSVY